MRKTKIICTIGPRQDDYKIMKKMALQMDVARFNFSHGTRESHKEKLIMLRKAALEAGRPIAAMLDTKGPEIRTGLLKDHRPLLLQKGGSLVLTADAENATDKVFINYPDIIKDIRPGHHILIDDGLIDLVVKDVNGCDILCEVVSGGELGEQKGVNIPDIPVRLPALTEKDKEDILFAIENDFDFIAASFVRDASCIEEIRRILSEKNSKIKIIAKIESQEGVKNFHEIVVAADGIMIARGDLGVEVNPKMLPRLQKDMIKKCNYEGKLVITATQMLDSMIRNPRPTRAEVTDVANAIDDGTDAIMLSGETASGKYPVEALQMMVSIAEFTEQFHEYDLFRYREMEATLYDSISNTTCRATVTAAHELKAAAIIAPTISGNTALLLSKYRPDVDIFALSPDEITVRQMMLFWGVRPLLAPRYESTDIIFEKSIEKLQKEDYIKKNDLCVITAGIFSGNLKKRKSAATNIMRIMEV